MVFTLCVSVSAFLQCGKLFWSPSPQASFGGGYYPHVHQQCFEKLEYFQLPVVIIFVGIAVSASAAIPHNVFAADGLELLWGSYVTPPWALLIANGLHVGSCCPELRSHGFSEIYFTKQSQR